MGFSLGGSGTGCFGFTYKIPGSRPRQTDQDGTFESLEFWGWG